MLSYILENRWQLQRPSDCALGFLTSLRKVLTPDLVGVHIVYLEYSECFDLALVPDILLMLCNVSIVTVLGRS